MERLSVWNPEIAKDRFTNNVRSLVNKYTKKLKGKNKNLMPRKSRTG